MPFIHARPRREVTLRQSSLTRGLRIAIFPKISASFCLINGGNRLNDSGVFREIANSNYIIKSNNNLLRNIETHEALGVPTGTGAWSTDTTQLAVAQLLSDDVSGSARISVIHVGNVKFFMTNAFDADGKKYRTHLEGGDSYKGLFVNGVRQQADTISDYEHTVNKEYVISHSGTHSYKAYHHHLFNLGGEYSGHAGLSLFLYWDRILSDAEHREIGTDPWQIFVHERRIIYFDVGASVGRRRNRLALLG